jgi:hypothetical protein
MKSRIIIPAILVMACAMPLHAQYLGIGLGRTFGDSSSAAASSVPGNLNKLSAEIRGANTLVLEAGANYLHFLRSGIHYNYSRPEGFLARGDAFGSSAILQLRAHTLTFDLGVRTPQFSGLRLFGVAGVGAGRFVVQVKETVEVPFPSGPPDSLVVPVVAYGGGLEHEFLPGVRWKAEVRDEWTSAPQDLFRPGGKWHRVLASVGILLGR